MGFIGGRLDEQFVERVRGVERDRLLAVPIDVGKHAAAALVCDFWGEVVIPAFTFELNERGLEVFTAPGGQSRGRTAGAVGPGWGGAGRGHYHRSVLSRLLEAGVDVALLNPAQVKENRAQELV